MSMKRSVLVVSGGSMVKGRLGSMSPTSARSRHSSSESTSLIEARVKPSESACRRRTFWRNMEVNVSWTATAVLMSSCHRSLKERRGPVPSQTMIPTINIIRAGRDPVAVATASQILSKTVTISEETFLQADCGWECCEASLDSRRAAWL